MATAVGCAVTNDPEAKNVVAVAACAPRFARGQTIMLPGAQVLSRTSTHEDPSPYMMVQKEPLVVEGGGVVEVVSLLVVVVIEEASELVVGSIVMVVIDVSDAVADGQERSGRSSCRFIFDAGAPQPAKALPGCLFQATTIDPAEGGV